MLGREAQVTHRPTKGRSDVPSVVEARQLVKRYGGFEAVAGIDFEVRRGEVLGMLGPNGAGKSTTMRMIYQVTPSDLGRRWSSSASRPGATPVPSRVAWASSRRSTTWTRI